MKIKAVTLLCVSFLFVVVCILGISQTATAQTFSNSQISTTTPLIITRPLYYSVSGNDVSALQYFLQNLGYFKYPTITGYFGSFTWKAVAGFQWDNKIESIGIVGPKTRAKIAELSKILFGNPTNPTSTSTLSQPVLDSRGCSSTSLFSTTTGQSCSNTATPPILFPHRNGYQPGFGGGGGSPAPTPDTTAPIVSITAPTDGSTVFGSSVTLSATASDNVSVAGVTFKIGGVVIGSEVTSSPYSVVWDSTATSSGSKSIVAVARDTSNNLATSTAVIVTSDNTAPVISSIATSSPTTTTLLVTWTTDELSDSKVDYGVTSSYGTASTSATFTTSHSLTLTGLDPTAAYHFRIQSVDGQGNIAVSSDQTLPILAYYVDSVNGDDINTGLSSTAPVQTIAHLTTLDSSAPLNTWNLATNSTWREQLNVPRSNMTIESYGAGTKPLLDASDAIIAGNWSKTAGQTNVYQVSINLAAVVNSPWVNVWENGSFLVRASSIANSDSTVGSYYPSAENGSITLYIHANGNTNPISDGKTYEVATRENGLNSLAVTGVTIRGIATRRNLGTTGGMAIGRSSFVYDSEANEGMKHNFYALSGSIITRLSMHDAYWGASGPIPFVAYDDTAVGEAASCTDCTVTMPNSPASSAGGSGFIAHASGVTPFTAFRLSGVVVTGLFSGATAGTNAGQLIITKSATRRSSFTIADITSASGVQALVPTTIDGLDVVINTAVSSSAVNIEASVPVTINDLNLTVTNSFVSNGVISTSANVNLTLTNSTITYAGLGVRLDGAGSTASLSGNSYTNIRYRVYDMSGSGLTLTSDNNAFHATTAGFVVGSNTYANYTLYRAGTGQDAHSTN